MDFSTLDVFTFCLLTSIPVGGYRFIGLGLAAHPSFENVVSILRSNSHSSETPTSDLSSTKSDQLGPLFLDLGCCVGQDIRSLAHARVPSSRIVGAELEPAFVEVGYDLFRDREKLGARFLFGDVLTLEASSPDNMKSISSSAPSSHPLQSLVGRVTVLWASAFLHLWDRPGQINACRRMVSLMRGDPGVKIIGRHAGSRNPGLVKHITNPGKGLMYKHNPESFENLWKEVTSGQGEGEDMVPGRDGRGKWVVKAWFEEDLFLTNKSRQDADQKPDSDWFTRVVGESSWRAEGSGGEKAIDKPNDDVRILVWEVERVE